MPTRGQGPRNDPRLVERRGDLSGLSALLFLLLVVLAFGIAFAVVLYVLRPAAGPVASPSTSPRPSATVAATASAVPTSAPSLSPSSGIGPSGAPGAVIVPVGRLAPVSQAGIPVGTVSVVSAAIHKTLEGEAAPPGSRWLLATMTYRATASLLYDANLWFALDTDGKRYPWRGSDPRPALGEGELKAGGDRTGYVSFEVPARKQIMSLVLTDADGNDIVVVTLPGG